MNIFKRLEHLRNKEMNNIITEIKNTLEGNISRINKAEKWISKLEDRLVEITAMEQNKEKRMKKKWGKFKTSGTTLNAPTFTL